MRPIGRSRERRSYVSRYADARSSQQRSLRQILQVESSYLLCSRPTNCWPEFKDVLRSSSCQVSAALLSDTHQPGRSYSATDRTRRLDIRSARSLGRLAMSCSKTQQNGVEGHKREKPTEVKCQACKGTGFLAVIQPAQPGRRIHPPSCTKWAGKGRITKVAGR